MPVSKHRKRSKQNSFGLRKQKKRAQEAYDRRRQYERNRIMEAPISSYVLEQNILSTVREIQSFKNRKGEE